MRDKCEICHRYLISPCGPLNAEILLAGEFPGWEEIKQGTPFVGRTGEVLKDELARVGIQFNRCRVTNLWLHEKTKECDVDYHVSHLMAEMSNQRKYILMMGSELTKVLMGKGVMELSGLRVESPYLPKGVIAVAAPNPATAFHGRIGEFRLAVSKFVNYIKEDKDAS